MTRRRLLRLAGILGASTVVAVLLAALLLRLAFVRRLEAAQVRFRELAGPLELTAYAPPPVPDPNNVAAWMKAGAAAILVQSEDRQLLTELDDRPAAKWSPEERQRAEALLGQLGPALTLLHHGAELADSSFGLSYTAGPAMPIPGEIGVTLLRATSLLAVESRLALEGGDPAAALRSARGVERIAAALGHEPILLFSILEEAASHRYLLLLRSIVESSPPEKVLAGLAADLRHREERCAPLSRAIAFDATAAYTSWKQGIFEGRMGLYWNGMSRLLGPLVAARTLEVFLQLVEQAQEPDRLADLPRQAPQWVRPWDVALLLVPNLTDAVARDKATESALELARLAIATRRIALEAGRYPASLRGAVEDPQPSPLSGEAPLYEHASDGGVVLSYPGAVRLWEEAGSDDRQRGALLTWSLPPAP